MVGGELGVMPQDPGRSFTATFSSSIDVLPFG